jgi:hypothetical protein
VKSDASKIRLDGAAKVAGAGTLQYQTLSSLVSVVDKTTSKNQKKTVKSGWGPIPQGRRGSNNGKGGSDNRSVFHVSRLLGELGIGLDDV